MTLDYDTLFPHQRTVLQRLMQSFGVEKPKVSLLTDTDGNKSLVFNIREYISDEDVARHLSGFINWCLPYYYHQSLCLNDYIQALFPVLPLEAGVMETIGRPEDAKVYPLDDFPTVRMVHMMVESQLPNAFAEERDEMTRTLQRLQAAYSADAVPTRGERRWREIALLPETRFRVDYDEVIGDNKEMPLLIVRKALPNEPGTTFRAVAMACVYLCQGVLLCEADWNREVVMTPYQFAEDIVVLRMGDLVDFLMTGSLERRRLVSDGWLLPGEYFEGRLTEPNSYLLPVQSRVAISHFMNLMGISNHKASLQIIDGDDQSFRLLHFSGHRVVGDDPQRKQALLDRIHWCLPRHYTVRLMDSDKYLPWPLLPVNDVPSPEFIDLDTDEEADDYEEEGV